MAVRFKQVTADKWPLERVRQKDVDKIYQKFNGQVMFPSSHDITPNNLNACEIVLYRLLNAGNRVLVVSKPHLNCIESLCAFFKWDRENIIFRFSIGACDDQILSYWEPNAPRYHERKQCLIYAYQSGFETSVSVEPMLDSANLDGLISDLCPYVTDAIWIGTMNHLERLEKGSDRVFKQAIQTIRQGQTKSAIKAIYQRHRNNPMIKWKKEIKKVVGLPIPKQNGLDI
jgi:DNA repair photolyase